MKVQTYKNPDAFLELFQSCPFRNEAGNSQVIGTAERLSVYRDQSEDKPTYVAVMSDDDRFGGIAVLGVRGHLNLGDASESALEAMITHFAVNHIDCKSVGALPHNASRFAKAWNERTGCTANLAMNLRRYCCDEVVWPRHCSGRWREATWNDFEQAVAWRRELMCEAWNDNEPIETARRYVASTLDESRVSVWEDGPAASTVIRSRETSDAGGISGVFTPRNLRGRGYASNLTAVITHWLLTERNKKWCNLFTDLANPTSNHIYTHVGYKPMEDWQHWRFEYGRQQDYRIDRVRKMSRSES